VPSGTVHDEIDRPAQVLPASCRDAGLEEHKPAARITDGCRTRETERVARMEVKGMGPCAAVCLPGDKTGLWSRLWLWLIAHPWHPRALLTGLAPIHSRLRLGLSARLRAGLHCNGQRTLGFVRLRLQADAQADVESPTCMCEGAKAMKHDALASPTAPLGIARGLATSPLLCTRRGRARHRRG